jgi:hypothetical protein
MPLPQLIPILQVAIGPVILVSGGALLLLSMTNRLGRVIDRSRELTRSLRSDGAGDREQAAAQLGILLRRARIVRGAIFFAANSVLLAAVLVIAIFLAALLGIETALPIILLFIACMLCLIGSLLLFIRDVNLSLRALRLDVASAAPRP